MQLSEKNIRYLKIVINALFIVIPFLPIWQWGYYYDSNLGNGKGGYVHLNICYSAFNYSGLTWVWLIFIIVGGLLGLILTILNVNSMNSKKPDPFSVTSQNDLSFNQPQNGSFLLEHGLWLEKIALYLVTFGLFFGIFMTNGIEGLYNLFYAPAIYIVFIAIFSLFLLLIQKDQWEKIRRDFLAYIFILPTFVIMIFIFYIPIFLAFYLSFQNFYNFSASRLLFLTLDTYNVGLQNYAITLFPDIPSVSLPTSGRTFNPQLDLVVLIVLIVLCFITIMYGTYGNWSIKKKVVLGAVSLYSVALIVKGWNALIYQNFDLFMFLGLLALASIWVVVSIKTAQTINDKYKQFLMYFLSIIPLIILYSIGGIFTSGYNTVSILNPFNLTYLRPSFLQVSYNTIIWTFGCVIPQILFGLLLAVVLNKKFYGRTIIRSIMIVPWAVPAFISITVMTAFVLPQGFGTMDLIFSWFHFQPYSWFANQNFLSSAILVNIYLGYSFTMVAFLAALQSVNPELYEAAEIDGANSWHKFRNITFPNIKPVVVVTSILGFMWTINMFNVIFLMYRPYQSVVRPENVYIFVIDIFYTFQGENYSIAAALSFILFVILIVITEIYTKITGKGPYDLD